jgi:glycosyltransferase involved in cell wall biosynthesis
LRAIAECDVLLRTTHYDGDSVAVREALHFGTPVIASDNGMRPEGVQLIPAKDLEKLVAAIPVALARGRDAVLTAGGQAENLRQMLGLYEELLQR